MFAFRLALALGYPHPDVLLDQITSKQFREWVAYYEAEPFGEERADLRMGILAATVNNRWRNKNENPAEPKDFMPFFREPEQSPEEIQRTLRSILGMVKDGQGNHYSRHQPGRLHRPTDGTD